MRLTDFQKLVAMNTLASAGMGMVAIFVPIYLLELGFSLPAAIGYLLGHHLTLLFAVFLVVFVSNKIGLVRCLYIRVALVALFYLGLVLLPFYPGLLFAIALASGLEAAFFWIPYNILTVRKTAEASIGSSLAFMTNVSAAVGLLIPGIAALLIVFVGYEALFAIAFGLILISIVPVLSLRGEKTEFRFSLPVIKEVVRSNRQFILPEIFDNLGQDAGVIWSLFIFVTALTVLDIGLLGVLTGIVGMLATHLTGVLIDTWSKKRLMRYGAIATTILWLASYLIAMLAPTPALLYAVTVLRGLALGVFAAAYGAIMFNRARGNEAQFLVLREIPTILGRIIVFSLAIFLASIGQMELTFLLVACLSLYFWFNDIDRLLEKAQY